MSSFRVWCIGYTWGRIPIFRKICTFLADFCLFIGRFSADFFQQNSREESEFGILLDFFRLFCPFRQTFGFWKIGFGRSSDCLPDIWQSFQKNWGERNLFFLQILEVNFGWKTAKNQHIKCRIGGKSEFGLTCSQCIMLTKSKTRMNWIAGQTWFRAGFWLWSRFRFGTWDWLHNLGAGWLHLKQGWSWMLQPIYPLAFKNRDRKVDGWGGL